MYIRCVTPTAAPRHGRRVCVGRVVAASSRVSPRSFRGIGQHTRLVSSRRPVRILGIETSCDDTGVAVVDENDGFLSERLSSQHQLHASNGGIIPPLAARQHRSSLPKLVNLALCDLSSASPHALRGGGDVLTRMDGDVDDVFHSPDVLNVSLVPQAERAIRDHISAVGVTIGPGLSPCLRAGLSTAKILCKRFDIPLVPVNHLEAHALVVRSARPDVTFPALVALVSGGHTQLLIAQDVDDFTLLGGTVDDSLGECLDKVARMLQLDVSNKHGGAALEDAASRGDPSSFSFTIPMRKYHNCDFSYSGLKSAVSRVIHEEALRISTTSGNPTPQGLSAAHIARPVPCEIHLEPSTKCDIAASFQKAAFTHLLDRMERALTWCNDSPEAERLLSRNGHARGKRIDQLIVSGGVAKNASLRHDVLKLAHDHGVECIFPPMSLCTDNGSMIAWTAMERYNKGLMVKGDELDAIKVHPRYALDPLFKPGEYFQESPMPRNQTNNTHRSARVT